MLVSKSADVHKNKYTPVLTSAPSKLVPFHNAVPPTDCVSKTKSAEISVIFTLVLSLNPVIAIFPE